MSDDVRRSGPLWWEIIGFAAIAALMLWDLAVDYTEGAGWGHIAAELLILGIAAVGAVLLWRRLKRTKTDLSIARADAERWRRENREILAGFSAAIAAQFDRWGLTEAETEIGFCLLKGLSHKEIADLFRRLPAGEGQNE